MPLSSHTCWKHLSAFCAVWAQQCRGCLTSCTCISMLHAHHSCLLWTMISNLKLWSQPVPLSVPKVGHSVLCTTELQKLSQLAQVLSHFRSPFGATVPTSSPPNTYGHTAVSKFHRTCSKSGKAEEVFFSWWKNEGTVRRLRGWGLCNLGKRWLQQALMSTYLCWQGSDEEMESLSHWCMAGWDTVAVSQAGYKEQLFPQESGQAVEEVIWKALMLEVFKSCLEKDLSNLV